MPEPERPQGLAEAHGRFVLQAALIPFDRAPWDLESHTAEPGPGKRRGDLRGRPVRRGLSPDDTKPITIASARDRLEVATPALPDKGVVAPGHVQQLRVRIRGGTGRGRDAAE